jgi:hypothetical protein
VEGGEVESVSTLLSCGDTASWSIRSNIRQAAPIENSY